MNASYRDCAATAHVTNAVLRTSHQAWREAPMARAPITHDFYRVLCGFTDADGHTWQAGLMIGLYGRPEEAPFAREVSAGTDKVTLIRMLENG
jgi:hypothetical protein